MVELRWARVVCGVVLALLLTACGPIEWRELGVRAADAPALPPASPMPALTDTPAATPSAAPTEAPTFTPSPVVHIDPTFLTPEPAEQPVDATDTPTPTLAFSTVDVSDQPLGPDNTVVVNRMASTADGWAVIYNNSGQGADAVIGYAPVSAGENLNVRVEVDPLSLTATLYAVLYHGRVGSEPYTPGAGAPGTNQWGEVASRGFDLAGSIIATADQPIGPGDTVGVPFVLAELPGWLVIHADEYGLPGQVIGFRRVGQGITRDLVIEIDATSATGTVYAMLHVDTGTAGRFEFPEADPPAESVQGSTVVQSFQLAGGG